MESRTVMTVAKVEEIVKKRYSEGAHQQVPELCCPRHPRETMGSDYRLTTADGEPCCGPDGCC